MLSVVRTPKARLCILLHRCCKSGHRNDVPDVLGEQITERGIGNGISIIIFAGIVAGLPPAIAHTIEQARQGDLHFLVLLLVAV
ncbi:hypothetical protein [Shigella flexneri]|uniref:hypothetical protein n=1 Tax=Shigella flexneri TaxID=623 RepID=UPI003C6F29E8